ncbi:MAG: ABC transporter permease [Actinomycetota bacterium]|nr:ABC transporter permease [Actinomycetota bacterium]
MLGLAARTVLARKWRALSTALAVFFGVAMVAGTLMLTDSVNRSFDQIFGEATRGTDVSIRPRVAVEAEFGPLASRGLDAALLADVRATAGVAKAQGAIGDTSITILDEQGERIGPPQGGPPHIALSPLDDPFSSFEIVAGKRPASANEVAIDSVAAEAEGFEVGERVRIAGPAGTKEYEISGIGEFGSGTGLGGASLAQFTLAEAQRLTDKQGRFDEINVAAADGTTPQQLAGALAAKLPRSVEVRTGVAAAREDAGAIKEGFGFLNTALLVFGGIAVFVGAFLIFNTFSIIVAQRVREFAMLRTLGATARQVLTVVLAEAALVGLLASLLGIAGGFAFVELVEAAFEAVGFSLPTSGLVLNASMVAIAIAVGVGATVVSALVPALRATRVAPLEALRESAGAQTTPTRRRRRKLIAILLAALGVGLIALGLFATDATGAALLRMGLGLVCVFIALAMLGDSYVPPLASAIGWPLPRLRGVTGQLARENARRQPGRTAITAAALMIGVTLVVFVGVFTDSIKASIDETLERQFAGDVAIVNTDGFSPIPSRIAQELARFEGVETVAAVAQAPARVRGVDDAIVLNGLDRAGVAKIADFEWIEGSDSLLAGLGPKDALVEQSWAEDNSVAVGDRILVTGPRGDRASLTVKGSVRDRPGLFVSSLAIARETLRERLGVRDDVMTFAGFADAADPEATRRRIDELLAERFANAQARSQQELKDDQAAQIDQLVSLIYVLLGLSVIVSTFGIVNTLSLTIFERTRELGMLRAIGTSRRQVRRMIRYESVITALLGAVVGATIGIGLGVAAVSALEEEGLVLSLSPTVPVAVLIAAVVIGVLAAIRPARRASRLQIVQALQYE